MLDILGRIKVEHDAGIVNINIADPRRVCIDDRPCPLSIWSVHQFIKDRPVENHRMTPPALVARDDDLFAAVAVAREDRPERIGPNGRMIREMDHHAVDFRRQRPDTDLQRGELTAQEISIFDDGQTIIVRNRGPNPFRMRAEYDDDLVHDFQHRCDNLLDEGVIADLEQRLWIAHAPRLARREQNSRDSRHASVLLSQSSGFYAERKFVAHPHTTLAHDLGHNRERDFLWRLGTEIEA